MKIKTSELTGAALDWAVAKCEGKGYELIGIRDDDDPKQFWPHGRRPSTDWSQGGPIIDAMMKEGLTLSQGGPDSGNARCWAKSEGRPGLYSGPTPLIAAMRCLVASKLGDEVDVPDELT